MRTLSVIGHGEFRRSFGRLSPRPRRPRTLRRSHSHPRPRCQRYAARRDGRDRSTLTTPSQRQRRRAAAEDFRLQAASILRSLGRAPELPCAGRFTDGVMVLKDCTELHVASFCLADAELRLAGGHR